MFLPCNCFGAQALSPTHRQCICPFVGLSSTELKGPPGLPGFSVICPLLGREKAGEKEDMGWGWKGVVRIQTRIDHQATVIL